MKVNFNVLGLTCDGGSRIVCQLANSLIAQGHSVSITSLSNFYLDWMDYSPLSKKIEVKIVKASLLMRMFRKAYLTKRSWNYNLKEVFVRAIPNCDVNVSAHSLLAYPTLLSGKGKLFHLIQAYEPQTQYYKDEYLKRESEFSYNLPMKKLCVSKHLADKVSGINIGNGVDLKLYKPLGLDKLPRSVMGINTRSTIPWKNGAMLEQVFTELRSHRFNILSPLRGTPDTTFVRFYNLASMYVFLSWTGYEGFSLQPLESMACGTPVVTTQLSYTHHLENAYVLPQNFTVSDVVGAVEKLNDDAELRDKLIINGLATTSKFSFNYLFDAFLKEIT